VHACLWPDLAPSVTPPSRPVEITPELLTVAEVPMPQAEKAEVERTDVDKDALIARLAAALADKEDKVKRLKAQLADPRRRHTLQRRRPPTE